MARVATIKIKKFKSHKEYALEIDSNHQHIIIYGDNGVGKTNLIESLSFGV
jgi:DNA replication and repair protein RecF